jgi:hypothetical protein
MTKGLPWPWSRWIDATGGVKPCTWPVFFPSSDRQDRLSTIFFSDIFPLQAIDELDAAVGPTDRLVLFPAPG